MTYDVIVGGKSSTVATVEIKKFSGDKQCSCLGGVFVQTSFQMHYLSFDCYGKEIYESKTAYE